MNHKMPSGRDFIGTISLNTYDLYSFILHIPSSLIYISNELHPRHYRETKH